MIVVGGMIGLGKTTVSTILGEHFGTEVFYESVDDNPILPLFYKASDDENRKMRYPFLLQLYFLDTRFRSIKKALWNDNNVLDRSIYEDWYFAKINHDLGRINDMEMDIYSNLLKDMMSDLQDLPKKSPDLMVYLSGSFETVMNRIHKRDRGIEQDPDTVSYFKLLWSGYDDWVKNCYDASDIVVINMDEMDVVENPDDRKKLLDMVDKKLEDVRRR